MNGARTANCSALRIFGESPPNSYELRLLASSGGRSPALVWRSQEDGKAVEYDKEPARSDEQKPEVKFLSLLPLDDEL